MKKVSASEQRFRDNATLVTALKLIFQKLKETGAVMYRLGDLISMSSGEPLTSSQMDDSLPYPVYGGGGLTGYYSRYLFENSKIAIGRVGARCGCVFLTQAKAWITDNALYVDAISDLLDEGYIVRALSDLDLRQQANQAAQPVVSQKKIYPQLIPVPHIELQRQINKFLEIVERRQQGDRKENLPDLPHPLADVRLSVARVEELAGKIEEVRSLRQQALEETQVLQTSSTKAIFTELAQAGTQPLRELVTVQGGGTPSKQNPFFWEGSIPWISPKDMKRREITDSIDHISEEATLKSPAKLLETASVLIVVRGMILAHTVPSAVLRVPAAINQDMKALFPNEKIMPEYLCCVLWGLNDLLLELVEKSTHDTRKLETPKLLNFKIPVPPIPEQRRIVAYLDELQAKVDIMKLLREEAMKELDALLPSILDKAFKGEL